MFDMSVCSFFDDMSLNFKDCFEFGVYCSKMDNDFLKHINYTYVYNEDKEEEKVLHEQYINYLNDFTKQRGIVISDLGYRDELVTTRLFNYESVMSYLFKLYGLKNISVDLIDKTYSRTFGNWFYQMSSALESELNETLVAEWDKLKSFDSLQEGIQRAEFLGFKLKESFSILCLDPEDSYIKDAGCLNCKTEREREIYLRNYNYYEHNGLFINKRFIDDNNWIDSENLMDWCEFVLNKTLKNLGMTYDKNKVEMFEQETEDNLEVEQDLER